MLLLLRRRVRSIVLTFKFDGYVKILFYVWLVQLMMVTQWESRAMTSARSTNKIKKKLQ